MNYEEIVKQITQLEQEVNKLERIKKKIEIENYDIKAGSIIRFEAMFYEEVVDYQIIKFPQDKDKHGRHIYKYGLVALDGNYWIHGDDVFDSLDSIKESMKNMFGAKWTIVQI